MSPSANTMRVTFPNGAQLLVTPPEGVSSEERARVLKAISAVEIPINRAAQLPELPAGWEIEWAR